MIDLKTRIVNGKEIRYFINDNGANIELVKMQPNIFSWCGYCTIDLYINIYGDNFDRWVSFCIRNFNTGISGESWFEVVVNEKRSYYGKWAGYRYTKASDTMGGGVRISVTRTCIDETEVRSAFNKFKKWLSDGAKENCYWHGLYKKNEFPETIAYGMPGEENVTAAHLDATD